MGTVMGTWDFSTGLVEYTDFSTADLNASSGNTLPVSVTLVLSGNDLIVRVTATLSGWTYRISTRFI